MAVTLADRLWGAGELAALFGDHSKVSTPWPSAARSKRPTRPAWRLEVADLLGCPPALTEVDPRRLLAGQPWVLREHAAHYLTGIWERIGRTSADHRSELNRFPVVRTTVAGDLAVVSGHHRALGALLQARPLLVRTVAHEGVAISPTLVVDGRTTAGEADRILADHGVGEADRGWLLRFVTVGP